ncbi:MAG TPA: F0F1 ATP synthase subunit A [Thermomicrobiales bacterium]|nr:F0F1 ATP synthase subunit A [Thermomicrobiales bacterium]
MEIHVEIAAETLFHVGPIPVTNSMLTMFLVMGGLLLAGWLIARNLQEVPGRAQALVELIVGFILGIVEGTAGRSFARKLIPLVGSIFIFILFANYSGLLPGVGTIGVWREPEQKTTSEAPTDATHEEGANLYQVASVDPVSPPTTAVAAEEKHDKVLVPFLRAPNADINMTLAMALVTFVTVQIVGIRSHGLGGRIRHMANPPFLFPIELIGEFSRIISLSARLFGNVFAGEVLMAVMIAMANAVKIAIIPLAVPVVFLFLEVLFGSIQALVFALLTAIYVVLAAGGHEEEDHDAGHADAHAVPQVAGSHGD